MLSTLRPAARTALRQQQSIRLTATANASTWANVKQGPPDAILGITEAFKKDGFKEKINLGAGTYRESLFLHIISFSFILLRLALITHPFLFR